MKTLEIIALIALAVPLSIAIWFAVDHFKTASYVRRPSKKRIKKVHDRMDNIFGSGRDLDNELK